jgi:hypothetical protein
VAAQVRRRPASQGARANPDTDSSVVRPLARLALTRDAEQTLYVTLLSSRECRWIAC